MASCPNLKEVYLDFHLTSSYISTLTDLADVPALKSVGFGRPSGLFLVRAAEWLPRVPHITGLHVLDATEVNPERFRQVLPGLHNITSLTLGPDHSLSPLTLLDTLWSLPQVEQLSVSYYNIPAELDVLLLERLSLSPSGLRNLHTFMVHHADVTSAPDYTALFSWIRSLVDSSPLRSLELVPMDASVCDNPAELLYIIRSKETMKRVVAEHVFVRRETAAALMRESGMKEVRFGVYPDVDAGERGITDHGRRDEGESASYSAISAVI
ncbi:hypothetical protein GLOTRDRAFT_133582 [Gloeophyllum trabeum ATCC 11539]|uniref:F-box domain-containing protein n=1 Tax=Gloeophyllum trabeum (strain ATCC 11539 / FP-39264 / Madison 617) TaxID=670483 RepID=S7PTR2_GLOTA|nr:uncharacterized protein GLOTRDRAFT_133582 [Gloeophyllum trabeum ATCC 11539]EPQ50838.1 hypothetical protein GLOTRDRAFT_133582 [Gloeophyllum trabeum ATCC 11539]